MKENDEEEEEVSSFDSLLLLNNNGPSPMMTTRPLWWWWWFTKDVLRRTTGGRTQLDEEDYDKDEEAEAEQRNTNREVIRVKVRGGSLVEEGKGRSLCRKGFIPRRALTHTRFASSLCVLWRVREAILWWLSLSLVMVIMSGDGMQGPSTHFNPQKAPSLSSSGEVVTGGCLYRLLDGRTRKPKTRE